MTHPGTRQATKHWACTDTIEEEAAADIFAIMAVTGLDDQSERGSTIHSKS